MIDRGIDEFGKQRPLTLREKNARFVTGGLSPESMPSLP
jgi:hypothetical protein